MISSARKAVESHFGFSIRYNQAPNALVIDT